MPRSTPEQCHLPHRHRTLTAHLSWLLLPLPQCTVHKAQYTLYRKEPHSHFPSWWQLKTFPSHSRTQPWASGMAACLVGHSQSSESYLLIRLITLLHTDLLLFSYIQLTTTTMHFFYYHLTVIFTWPTVVDGLVELHCPFCNSIQSPFKVSSY